MTIHIARDFKLVPIESLAPYEKNARTHSEEQISQIAKSISEFGFTNPILVDGEKGIIAGHGRLAAAKKLGIKDVPIIELSHLTPAQKRAYIIADNKLALNAGWDEAVLAEEIEALKLEDFDIDLLGFSDEELADLHIETEELPPGAEDEIGEAQADPKVTIGDIFILGNHRLMCGDATSADDVAALLQDAKPTLMVTDTPYGVEYEAGWRAEAKGRVKTEREETSNLQNDDRADWYDAWALFPGSVAYVWHASAFTDVVKDSLQRAAFEVKQQIIWNKNIHALSRSHYHWKHEPCWYAVRERGDANWLGGRDKMTVWDVKTVQSEKDKTAHPTQKPVAIYEIPIENHTRKGDSLYEPFGGSGTQIIACEKLGRISYTMELDPKFVAVILDRFEKYSGKKAHRLDGVAWSEIKAGE